MPTVYFCLEGEFIVTRISCYARELRRVQWKRNFQCSGSKNLDHIEGHYFNFKVYAFGTGDTQAHGIRLIFCIFVAVLCHSWCVLFHEIRQDWQFSHCHSCWDRQPGFLHFYYKSISVFFKKNQKVVFMDSRNHQHSLFPNPCNPQRTHGIIEKSLPISYKYIRPVPRLELFLLIH